MELSQSMQDYLKAILLLSSNGPAPTSDIATRLGVNPASVTGMLKKLAELHLVKYERHKGVSLLPPGRKIALEVLRHHRLIETYLHEAMGFSWDQVHDEAERLEHHISEAFEDRIAELLGHPEYDPHGDPIPTKDGRMPPVVNDRLADVNVGETVTVRRVAARENSTLKYLKDKGIALGSSLRIMKRAEDQTSLAVQIKRSTVELPMDICRIIYVER